ncbi:MAG: cobalt transporter CbiM [Alphaproteobacteria bacterium]|nr:cobalt transporter CbiM [Alphaproteobacteria bacterium]
MAHIPDGILSVPVLLAGAAIGAGGLAIGLKRLAPERIPQVAVLSGLLFVAALVHFPVGPSSAHLILNGLIGISLGWAAFPAIFVALVLQAVLFGFGGLLVLGVNLTNLAVPAVLCGLAFNAVIKARPAWGVAAAGVAGAFGVAASMLMVALSLAASGREFLVAAQLVLVTHLPVMAIEAAFTAAAAGLLLKVRPGFLGRGAVAVMVLAATLTAAGPALAHKLTLFASTEGNSVSGHAYFSGGDRAQGVVVTVTDPAGAVLHRLTTDAQGAFSFTASSRADHRISVEGDDGHAAQFTIAATELPDTLAPGAPAPDLQAMIDASLARQLRPLREQLAATHDKIWWHDVVGGLGAIIGFFGLAYGLSARKDKKS